MIKRILFFGMLLFSSVSIANEIHVAVASNFANTLSRLADQFELETGSKVTLIVGSTGQHYAQMNEWCAL